MTAKANHAMQTVLPAVWCEWCRTARALERNCLCGPCHADFLASEAEGQEMTAADFEAEAVLRGGR